MKMSNYLAKAQAHKRLTLSIVLLSVFTIAGLVSINNSISAMLSDVDKTSYEGQSAMFLEKREIISGFPDGTFRGYLSVNRAQAAKMLLLAGGRDINRIITGGVEIFPDLVQGEWYEQYVLSAVQYGIMKGYPDGTFGPQNPINRAEFLKMVTITFDLDTYIEYHYTDVPDNVWFAQYAGAAEKYNLFLYDTDVLNPAQAMTRDEVAWALYQMLIYKENDIIIRTPSDFTPTGVAIQPQVLSEVAFSPPTNNLNPAAPVGPAPVAPVAPAPAPASPLSNCTDTDATDTFPLGINQNEEGVVSIPDGLGGTAIFTDFCLDGLGPNVLLEYFCSNLGALTSEKLNCPAICDNGACVRGNIDQNAIDPRRPTGTFDVPASSSSSQGPAGAPVPAPAPPVAAPVPVPAPVSTPVPPPPPPPPPPPAVTTSSTLFITQKTTGIAGTADLGQKDVTLIAFEGIGGVESINIIQVSFSAVGGVTSARNVDNYSLWADTNNDGAVDLKLQEFVQVNNAGVIAFSQIGNGGVGFTVGSALPIRLEVHGNIGDVIRNPNLQLQFALDSELSNSIQSHTQTAFLSGIQRDGQCPQSRCNTFLTTAEAKTFTITDGGSPPPPPLPPPPSTPQVTGSLSVKKNALPIFVQNLLGGTLSENIATYEFRSLRNSIDIREIQIRDRSNRSGRSIQELRLYFTGSSQPFAVANNITCPSFPGIPSSALFCANIAPSVFRLSQNQDRDIFVRAFIKLDSNGGVSGDTVEIGFDNGSVGVRAFDNNVGAFLLANNGNGVDDGEVVFDPVQSFGPNREIFGNIFDVSMSAISTMENGLFDADGSTVPTGVSQIGGIRITAKDNTNFLSGLNSVRMSDFIFTVELRNILVDKNSLKIYEKRNSLANNKIACEAVGPGETPIPGQFLPAVSYVICQNLAFTDVLDTMIPPGFSSTFILEGDVVNNRVNNALISSLQVKLERYNDRSSVTRVDPLSSVAWFDNDGVTNAIFFYVPIRDETVRSTLYQN